MLFRRESPLSWHASRSRMRWRFRTLTIPDIGIVEALASFCGSGWLVRAPGSRVFSGRPGRAWFGARRVVVGFGGRPGWTLFGTRPVAVGVTLDALDMGIFPVSLLSSPSLGPVGFSPC
ncbi:hypothetical protein U1Q18_026605 [Sarracenia purpurea var. burkii]